MVTSGQGWHRRGSHRAHGIVIVLGALALALLMFLLLCERAASSPDMCTSCVVPSYSSVLIALPPRAVLGSSPMLVAPAALSAGFCVEVI